MQASTRRPPGPTWASTITPSCPHISNGYKELTPCPCGLPPTCEAPHGASRTLLLFNIGFLLGIIPLPVLVEWISLFICPEDFVHISTKFAPGRPYPPTSLGSRHGFYKETSQLNPLPTLSRQVPPLLPLVFFFFKLIARYSVYNLRTLKAFLKFGGRPLFWPDFAYTFFPFLF